VLRFGCGFGFRYLGLELDLGLVSNLPNLNDRVSIRTIHLPGMLHSQKRISGFGAKSFGFGIGLGTKS
jgi:hypothetical protein